MPSDHPPTSTARVEYKERIRDSKQEVWKADGKGWREVPLCSVERDIEKLGLRREKG